MSAEPGASAVATASKQRVSGGWGRRTWPIAACGAALLAVVGTAPLAAQAGRLWRRDERVLVTSFGEMLAAARGPRHVFAVTPDGIVAYDFAFDRWEPPLTAADGFPADERPSTLAYDPAGGTLWLGTSAGSLYSLTPGIDRWDRISGAGFSPVLEIVPYAREGAVYVATERGWLTLRAGSFIADRVPAERVPAEVRRAAEDAHARRDPFLDAARATLGLDPAMRRWPITDAERGEHPGEYWITTFGGGLVRFDTRFQRAEWLSFGTLARGAGSIALDGERIWFGGDGRGPRNGVAASDARLQRWRLLESGFDGAPGGAVMDILATGEEVWFAATDGLYRLDARSLGGDRPAGAWQRLTARHGLPADAATSLAPAGDGVWVGTTRGLVRLDPEQAPSPILLPGVRVNRLAAVHDTLWIATDEGLFVAGGWSGAVERAPGAAPRSRILDVVAADDVVYVILEGGYHRRAAGEWTGPERAPALARLGRLGRAAAEHGALWLGGENGLGRLDLETGSWTYYLGGADLPRGPVREVVPAGDDVWVATPAGAFRFRWRR